MTQFDFEIMDFSGLNKYILLLKSILFSFVKDGKGRFAFPYTSASDARDYCRYNKITSINGIIDAGKVLINEIDRTILLKENCVFAFLKKNGEVSDAIDDDRLLNKKEFINQVLTILLFLSKEEKEEIFERLMQTP